MSNQINVIGAGVTGLTIAACLAKKGIGCTVIEKNDFLGGSCASYYENGIEVHKFGSHIFHTDSSRVWEFLHCFSKFNTYQHKVLALYNGHMFRLPFGLDLINQFYNSNLKPNELESFLQKLREPIEEPKNLEEQALKLVGKQLYEAFIKDYTSKQWNCHPSKLSSDIIKRIPFRSDYNVNYFNDQFQGIPVNGYDWLFKQMADSEYITINYGQDFTLKDIREDQTYFYSGPIDKLLEYCYGPLPWRSLSFQIESLPTDDFQGTAVVNYVESKEKFTRIHEFKHYHPESKLNGNTVICKEFPVDYDFKKNDPYYPIDTKESRELYQKYVDLLNFRFPNVKLCGRLGLYKYFDMDDAISGAMEMIDQKFK